MQEYHVPRQVTTRLEFLPGFSWPEMAALGGGVAVGYVLHKIGSWLHLPSLLALVAFAFPPLLVFMALTGGEQSLWRLFGRLRWFQSRPQRMLYRTGGGIRHGIQSAAKTPPATTRTSPASRPISPLSGIRKQQPQAQDGTVQGWLPVADIIGGVAVRRDNTVVAAIEVQPINMGLKSLSEQQRIIARLHEVINSLHDSIQILTFSRPVDLDHYVFQLENHMRSVNQTRRELLQPYIHYVKHLVAEGEAQERRFYILLPQHVERGSGGDLLHLAHDIVARLLQADLHAHVLDELELINALHVWCHPSHAAFERAPAGPPSVTVLSKGDGR